MKTIDVPSRVITGMRTIPNSNLAGRKKDVLDIHRENLRMVKRLAQLDAQQGILNREVSPENVFWFRSKSHRSKHRSRSNSLTKQTSAKIDNKSRPVSREARAKFKSSSRVTKPNQTISS